MKKKLYIISGSPDVDYEYIKSINFKNKVIYAVDSGMEVCKNLKIRPDKIIGDFDTYNIDSELKNYDKNMVYRFSTDKNRSDTEIAVDMGLKKNFEKIIILNATGSRLDHEMFNINLTFKKPGSIIVDNNIGKFIALKKNELNTINMKRHKEFSLVPLGVIKNLTIKNARYELKNKDVNLNSLTLSNKATENKVNINFDSGKLLIYIVKGNLNG